MELRKVSYFEREFQWFIIAIVSLLDFYVGLSVLAGLLVFLLFGSLLSLNRIPPLSLVHVLEDQCHL